MEQKAPFMLVKTENYGIGSPFFARLFLFVLQLRDKLLYTEEEKLLFDNAYARFLEPAKTAYLSFRKIVAIHHEFISQFEFGSTVFIQNNTFTVNNTIDSDARSLTNSILSEAEIAFKGYINEFAKLFDDFQLGFMAQKESRYQAGINNLRDTDDLIACYLDRNRKAWVEKLTSIRNRKEHDGWQLAPYQYQYDENKSRIVICPPKINGMMYLDFLQFILSGLFTFVEELTVHLLSLNLEYQYVYQIPLEERKKEHMAKFATSFITDKKSDPWILEYLGPDYTLTE